MWTQNLNEFFAKTGSLMLIEYNVYSFVVPRKKTRGKVDDKLIGILSLAEQHYAEEVN